MISLPPVATPLTITAGLLAASNPFMTFAWYGRLKHLNDRTGFVAAMVSWGIALFEYLPRVPANRVGVAAGITSAPLKITQEVITLAVFVRFAVVYMQQLLNLDCPWATLFLVGAVYFIVRG